MLLDWSLSELLWRDQIQIKSWRNEAILDVWLSCLQCVLIYLFSCFCVNMAEQCEGAFGSKTLQWWSIKKTILTCDSGSSSCSQWFRNLKLFRFRTVLKLNCSATNNYPCLVCFLQLRKENLLHQSSLRYRSFRRTRRSALLRSRISPNTKYV